MNTREKHVVIHPQDSVAVAIDAIEGGSRLRLRGTEIEVRETIQPGHKIALKDIRPGERVIKYGYPIGNAQVFIPAGSHVHVHNLATALREDCDYAFGGEAPAFPRRETAGTFPGFLRKDGSTGIRNEIWIVNSVGCVNKTAEILAREANRLFQGRTDGIFTFSHPFGCSQLGEDHRNTQKILAGLVRHPNAGGVLVLGLGCENNNIAEFRKVLGETDPERVDFLVAQDYDDEIEEGLRRIERLVKLVEKDERGPCPVSALTVGLKCGGSDGFSGITANPLIGRFSDLLVAAGGSSVLTEVPEMFGAETILMDRAADEGIFRKTVDLINGFKGYYRRHDQVIYENPSPGNKKGGISTLEEKSLGCTQKGGSAVVVDVLPYGGRVTRRGLNLLSAPGNDIVASTALVAAGCQIVLFSTGRGTPLGSPVPTIKVASNSDLARRKAGWIDFDAGTLLAGEQLDRLGDRFFDFVLEVASGKTARNEEAGYREIAIFKDGVVL